jgi:hypothetical protein
MANHRVALHIAAATGRLEHDPKRFKDRATPDNEPLGDPEPDMSPRECELWLQMVERMWWMREHHRFSFACMVRIYAALESKPIDIKLLNAYAKYAGMLGADCRSDQKFGKQDNPRKGASEFTGR